MSLLFCLAASTGCAGRAQKNNVVYMDAAAQRAGFDLGCSADSFSALVLDGGGMAAYATVGVTGCERSASYVCKCDAGANIFGAITCSGAICVLNGTTVPAQEPAPASAPPAATPPPATPPPPPPT
jgi:hypothetical protein